MKVSDLRGILQYVPRFREKTFVVALDGEVAASQNLGNLLLDLAVLRSLSIKVILVHGCGAQLVQLAQERGIAITSTDRAAQHVERLAHQAEVAACAAGRAQGWRQVAGQGQ